MNSSLFEPWRNVFLEVIQEPSTAAPLKAASLAADLKSWTSCLTSAVVKSCGELGWPASAKGHRIGELPKTRSEYLNMDVMALSKKSGEGRWPLPQAVFELENNRSDDVVAYSLWKVLCIRSRLRVVFAFRNDWEASRKTVETVGRDVVGSLTAVERKEISGETVLIVGNRGEGETFPWEYFKMWKLDTGVGRFEKV